MIVAEFWPGALRERGLRPGGGAQVLPRARAADLRVHVGNDLSVLKPVEVVRTCDQAGPSGQVNLVLTPLT